MNPTPDTAADNLAAEQSLQSLREQVLKGILTILAVAVPIVGMLIIVTAVLNEAMNSRTLYLALFALTFTMLRLLHSRLGFRACSILLLVLLLLTAFLVAVRGGVAVGNVILIVLALMLSCLFFGRKGAVFTFIAMIVAFGLAGYLVTHDYLPAPATFMWDQLTASFWIRQLTAFIVLGLALVYTQVFIIEKLVALYTTAQRNAVLEKQQREELEAERQAREQEQELRLQAQRELQESRRIEALARLAGGIAHDFNNTLGVILGNAELGLLNNNPPATQTALNEILRASTSATELTQQLLTLGRKQASHPAMIDVGQHLLSYVTALKRILPANIAFALLLDPGVHAWLDLGMLERTFYNLVLNARDAMPGGGVISVGCREHTGKTGPSVELVVADNGNGMDAETLSHLFEPFYSTKGTRGTGLGLALIQAWMLDIGGEANAESAPGAGTRIILVFPVGAAVAQQR